MAKDNTKPSSVRGKLRKAPKILENQLLSRHAMIGPPCSRASGNGQVEIRVGGWGDVVGNTSKTIDTTKMGSKSFGKQ